MKQKFKRRRRKSQKTPIKSLKSTKNIFPNEHLDWLVFVLFNAQIKTNLTE
jgi:hypothetical protein